MQRKLAEILEDVSVGELIEGYNPPGGHGPATTGLIVSDLGAFMTALVDFSDLIEEAKGSGSLGDSTECLAYAKYGTRVVVY